MESLVRYREALDRFFRAAEVPALERVELTRARRSYPEEGGGWAWVRLDDEVEVVDQELVQSLDARFAVVERLFRSYERLWPRLRPQGDEGEPRGVEMWEWSCIGLHRLWEAVGEADGVVRADLRPALLSFDGEEVCEARELSPYELFFPVEAVEAVREEMVEVARAAMKRPAWHRMLALAAQRHGLGADDKPTTLFKWLHRDGLIARKGAAVTLSPPEGEAVTVKIATYRKVARRALDGELD